MGVVAPLVLAIVAGHLLGVPVALSYVETGSMEPTIGTGDGFVAILAAVSGPIEEGDVVVFDA
jgi:signal peptidase I